MSKKLAKCSLKAALAYPWIFLVADDWGRFEYEPQVIWGQAFSKRADVSIQDVKDWLFEYELHGLLVRYHIDGELAYWTGFEGRSPSKRRPSLIADPQQFEGWVEEKGTGDLPAQVPSRYPDPADFIPPAEQSRAEIEQSRAESGAPAPKYRVKKTQTQDTPELRAYIDSYNEILGCRIGYPGNLDIAARAQQQGHSLDTAEKVFRAVRDRSTKGAKWCAENNFAFDYLLRGVYKNNKGEIKSGPMLTIPNELGQKPLAETTGGSGEAARISQAFAEKAARKAANG